LRFWDFRGVPSSFLFRAHASRVVFPPYPDRSFLSPRKFRRLLSSSPAGPFKHVGVSVIVSHFLQFARRKPPAFYRFAFVPRAWQQPPLLDVVRCVSLALHPLCTILVAVMVGEHASSRSLFVAVPEVFFAKCPIPCLDTLSSYFSTTAA